jgi:predicted  nucleic acid-binding Zn-ribbon protein
MPAKKGGDSKQGLIIALVCFVILTIVFGVTTYLGYSGQTDSEAKASDAQKKEATAKNDRDWYKFQAVQYRSYLGYPPENQADATALENLRPKFSSMTGEGKDEVAKLVDTLDKDLGGYDQQKNRTATNFKEKTARLETDLKNTQAKLDDAEGRIKKGKDSFDGQILTKEQEVNEWKKKFEGAQAANLKDQQDREQAFADKLNEFNNLNKDITELKKKADEDQSKADKGIKKLESDKRELQNMNTKLKDKLTPPDLLRFSEPKGKIVQLDPKGEVAWINIGSADNVRVNQDLTFSVFGSGQGGKADNIRKGAIEVVDVTGPHLSMAKITEVVDPSRTPIVTGDLLINPAWSPQARQHVAIAGFIDLTGEGRNNIDEFMSNLKKQGMVIDAWLDLSDVTVKGDGMTLETNYLIVGAQPEFKDTIRADDASIQQKGRILEAVAGMRKEANDKGVTVVPLHKFVAMTGYRLPKGAGVTVGFGFEGRQKKTSAAESKPAEKKTEKEDKDDKKDDGDK